MDYLQQKIDTRKIEGVHVTKMLTICYRIFAENVGIFIPTTKSNFNNLQEALKLYETASRAKLNMSKSMIIPHTLLVIPNWLHNTGCTVNLPGEIHKYLGAPFGFQLKASEMHNFFLDCISKKILGWAKKLLSFTGKVILIQHVLRSITIYHMMYMVAPVSTIKQINCLFKAFYGVLIERMASGKCPSLHGINSPNHKRKVVWDSKTTPPTHMPSLANG